MTMLFKLWIHFYDSYNLYFYSALLHISFYDTDMEIHEEDWKYFFGEKKEFLI